MKRKDIKTLKGGRRIPHKLESAYIYMIDDLKQQLAEKDKEIELLQREIIHRDKVVEEHVCEKVKTKINELMKEVDDIFTPYAGQQLAVNYNLRILEEFLNQIKKGK